MIADVNRTLRCACRGLGPVCTEDCERDPAFDIVVLKANIDFAADTELLETRLAIARELLSSYRFLRPKSISAGAS